LDFSEEVTDYSEACFLALNNRSRLRPPVKHTSSKRPRRSSIHTRIWGWDWSLEKSSQILRMWCRTGCCWRA